MFTSQYYYQYFIGEGALDLEPKVWFCFTQSFTLELFRLESQPELDNHRPPRHGPKPHWLMRDKGGIQPQDKHQSSL